MSHVSKWYLWRRNLNGGITNNTYQDTITWIGEVNLSSDIERPNPTNKSKLIKVTDIFGRDITDYNNKLLIYVYSNGKVEKKINLKNKKMKRITIYLTISIAFFHVTRLDGLDPIDTGNTITTQGLDFIPELIYCDLGDTIFFELTPSHNAVQVSEKTYQNNGGTPLDGGLILTMDSQDISFLNLQEPTIML